MHLYVPKLSHMTGYHLKPQIDTPLLFSTEPLVFSLRFLWFENFHTQLYWGCCVLTVKNCSPVYELSSLEISISFHKYLHLYGTAVNVVVTFAQMAKSQFPISVVRHK